MLQLPWHNIPEDVNLQQYCCDKHKYHKPQCSLQEHCSVHVTLSLHMRQRHIGAVEVQLYSFLAPATDGHEQSTSFPGPFKPSTTAPRTLWTEGRLDPCNDLDILEM